MSIKIGIMTYFHAVNYGAYLQSYALCERLNQEEDFEAEIINFRMQKEVEHYLNFIKPKKNIFRMRFYIIRNKIFESSIRLMKLSDEHCVSDRIEDFIDLVRDKYDVLIAGSDEIWKVNSYRGFPTPYYLPDNLGARKLAYAASGRAPFRRMISEKQELLRSFLLDFEYIGTRDKTTFNEVGNLLNSWKKVYYNYDPTLIYDFKPDREHGRRILKERYHVNVNKKCIGIMFSEKMNSKDNLVRYLKKSFGSEIALISLYDWEFGIINAPDLTPLDWIDVVAALDGMISHYFHAICIAIITGTPFYAVEMITNDLKESKMYDLLERFHLLNRHTVGISNAIGSGEVKRFIQGIKPGDRLDNSLNLQEARSEFEKFIKIVRCNNYEEQKTDCGY